MIRPMSDAFLPGMKAVLRPVAVHAAHCDLAELRQFAQDSGYIFGTDIVCVDQHCDIDIIHFVSIFLSAFRVSAAAAGSGAACGRIRFNLTSSYHFCENMTIVPERLKNAGNKGMIIRLQAYICL